MLMERDIRIILGAERNDIRFWLGLSPKIESNYQVNVVSDTRKILGGQYRTTLKAIQPSNEEQFNKNESQKAHSPVISYSHIQNPFLAQNLDNIV